MLVSTFCATFIVMLHAFSSKMKIEQASLIVWPLVHIGISVLSCLVLWIKPRCVSTPKRILIFWLFMLYIDCAIWGFRSNDFNAYNYQNQMEPV